MVDVASRATKGVTIAGQKATQAEIICMFKDYLRNLKARLNVRSSFSGIQPIRSFLIIPRVQLLQAKSA